MTFEERSEEEAGCTVPISKCLFLQDFLGFPYGFFVFSELWWHFFNGAMYHNAFQNVEIGEKLLHPDHLGILQI